jgi:DNA-binding winged helix-turn-helix (wHTH) protein
MARELALHIFWRGLTLRPARSASLPGQAQTRYGTMRRSSVVRFGTYEVSLQSGEVRKSGLRIRVQQQPMKLLEILLERPGEVVTREELRARVWADESFGDFDQAVNIAIAKLRSALGDSAENPRYIETLPKRGYRFIGYVSVVIQRPAPKSRSLRLEICLGHKRGWRGWMSRKYFWLSAQGEVFFA